MSPSAQALFMNEVYPLIMSKVARGSVKPTGSEDKQELAQDCLASAAQMINAAEESGKPLYGKSVAYYAVQRAKTGRRSTSAGRTDVLAPSTTLDGNAVVMSLDASVTVDDEVDNQTLGEMLAGPGDDPCITAGRNIDWAWYMSDLDACDSCIVKSTAEGSPNTEVARLFNVSSARVTQRKRKIGRILEEKSKGNILRDAQSRPLWEANIRVCRERALCWSSHTQEFESKQVVA